MPAALRALREGEREQNERNARADENETDKVELLREGPCTTSDRDPRLDVRTDRRRGDETELLGFALSPGERDNERRERCGHEYGEHAICEK